MRYIIYTNHTIVGTLEIADNDYTITYPGYQTVAVMLDSNLWQNVVDNPEEYIYKDGQVVSATA